MSSGLMSCVRENSPPLELDLSEEAGPLSLPEARSKAHGFQGPTTSTPIAFAMGAAGDSNCSAIAEQQQHQQQQQQQQQHQQQKRRRFHPLRNLRRIFRRRTINSADTAAGGAAVAQVPGAGAGAGSCNTLPPPTSSSSEKNLRSVALSGSGSTAAEAVTASSPASPLTPQQLHESYQTQSLPKSKSYGAHRDELLSVLLGKKRSSKSTHCSSEQTSESQSHPHHQPQPHPHPHPHPDNMYQAQRQQLGVAVFPDSMGMSRSSYFAEKRLHQRQLRSVGDSSQELDAEERGAVGVAADMSDSQRSLSEERLLDVDVDVDGSGYTRETLSQSHDSVFSESATASSLSIVLKAELTDVLRKRRNRPDASDEDLGLPRSPSSPQRHADVGHSRKAAGYQPRGVAQGHEASSLSLLSVNSTDGEDSQSQSQRQHSTKSISSSDNLSSVVLRDHSEDAVDAVGPNRQRLSHAAAKHKMAIRPAKKKGPTRQHRRTLDTSIPEANEELLKMSLTKAHSPSLRTVKESDLKTKTRSLPPRSCLAATTTATASVATNTSNNSTTRTKTVEQKSSAITNTIEQRSTSTSTTHLSTSSSQMFGLRSLTFKAANALFDVRGESSTDGDDLPVVSTDSEEHGFLRRLIQRNSKRSIARANDGLEDLDTSQNLPKKLQISTSCLEATTREPVLLPNKSRSATSHEQHVQETRQIIKREIQSEGKHGLNAMVSNYGVQPQPPTAVKPKSGPAARQRYLPKELGATVDKPQPSSDTDVTNLLSKSSRGNDTFQSTALVRKQTQVKAETSATSMASHFERKPRIVGLSAFQQKLSRSNDSMGQHSSSSNSLETSTDEPSPLYYEEKQRKTVEKSRSFRNYQDDVITESASMHSNMPSLPDLSISFRVPPSYYKQQQSPRSPMSPMSPISPTSPSARCASLGFEINDNKLLQSPAESSGKLVSQTKASPQRSSTLLVPSPAPTNISQIEQNIDLIVKSPMVSLLRKSGAVGEQQPPQRPKVLDLKQTTTIAIGSPVKDAAAVSAKLSSSPPSTPSKSSQRNSSNVESPSVSGSEQPEFMKIQLNRVDQARLHSKANHLVLSKNVKACSSPAERSQSSDDLTMRRLSSESTGSIQIVEHFQKSPSASSATSPTQPLSISKPAEALGKQQHTVSATSLIQRSSSSSSSCHGGSNEVLVAVSPAANTPGTPKSPSSKPVAVVDLANSPAEKGNTIANANRFSLEERKRLFLSEEKAQAERKLAELRFERQKSLNEELQRKPDTASPVTAPNTPPTPSGSDGNGNGNGNGVVLRKKSFGSANGVINGIGNGNGNGNVNGSSGSQEDGTPELMKVFARRSLKVKDDDVVALAQVAAAAHKKMSNGSQSVDSDKENQSNSNEKLDKLATNSETPKLPQNSNNALTHSLPASNNRSSVGDFRNLNNNLQPAQQKLSNLPPIKVSNARNSIVSSNNKNNNNCNNGSSNIRNDNNNRSNDRFSLQLKPATTAIPSAPATVPAATTTTTTSTATTATEPPATPTKPIERSATMCEFKGIHQRRAEWEQRVKEALK